MEDRRKRLAKRNVATALLNQGSLFIHLDPRITGVVVPPWLYDKPQLVLQVGWDLPIPIPDLRVDEAGIFGTLSFSKTPFACNTPWDSIFALVGDEGQGMVWEDSMPPEIAAEVEQEARRAAAKKASSPTPLQRVKPVYSTSKAKKPRKKSKLKLPPYIRVIK